MDRLIDSNGRNKTEGTNILEKTESRRRNMAKNAKHNNNGTTKWNNKISRLRDSRRNTIMEIYENGLDDMEDVEFNGLFEPEMLLKLKKIQDQTIFNICMLTLKANGQTRFDTKENILHRAKLTLMDLFSHFGKNQFKLILGIERNRKWMYQNAYEYLPLWHLHFGLKFLGLGSYV